MGIEPDTVSLNYKWETHLHEKDGESLRRCVVSEGFIPLITFPLKQQD